MAKPTPEEIEEFNRRMNEPDDSEDDFEIEIFTPEGHGARLPYSRGRQYLQQHFGIDVGDAPNAGDPANNDPNAGEDPLNSSGASRPRTSSRYFGKTTGANAGGTNTGQGANGQPVSNTSR